MAVTLAGKIPSAIVARLVTPPAAAPFIPGLFDTGQTICQNGDFTPGLAGPADLESARLFLHQ